MNSKDISKSTSRNSQSRVPDGSVLFEKIIPVILILMGFLTVILILFAMGVLFGVVKF